MARISTYPIDAAPTVEDILIGTEVDNLDVTKNYRISDILALGNGGTVVTATSTTLGISKLATDTVELKATNTITSNSGRIYGVQHNSSDQMVVNVPWTDTAPVQSLTTTGNSGVATLSAGGDLNIPNYTPYDSVFMGLNIHSGTGLPEIQVHYNTTGATFTVATSATVGEYVITSSLGIFPSNSRTHFSVMNPNAINAISGTGILPQPTTAKTKNDYEFAIETYNNDTSTVSGGRQVLPTAGLSVTIEFRIYPINI